MGFTLNFGNNVHICLETDSRKGIKRQFNALSAGGNITMPLEDMSFLELISENELTSSV